MIASGGGKKGKRSDLKQQVKREIFKKKKIAIPGSPLVRGNILLGGEKKTDTQQNKILRCMK